jgi:capsular polysaccharide biosynthesis protein
MSDPTYTPEGIRPLPETEHGAGGEMEIDLVELLFQLVENIKYIIGAALLCAMLAAAYVFFLANPVYEATAKLYVMSNSDSAINLSDLQIGAYLTNDYQEVFKTWEVHEMVLENLNLNLTYAQMTDMLTVANPKDTRILYITVRAGDAQQATDIANEYAAVVKKYISQTMATEEPNILSVALRPNRPISPTKTRDILLGLIAGALLAAAVIIVRFVTDDRIKSPDDLQKYLGFDTLAIMPSLGAGIGKGKQYRAYDGKKDAPLAKT